MKNPKVWLALALVFFAGFAAGVVTTRTIVRETVRSVMQRPAVLQGKIERDLNRHLNLNPQQRVHVREVLRESRERLREVRRDFQPRLRSVVVEARQEIQSVLTPEQRRRFQQYLAEHPLPQGLAAEERRQP
jgi:Spy/CpxP family protein refolding chaperone